MFYVPVLSFLRTVDFFKMMKSLFTFIAGGVALAAVTLSSCGGKEQTTTLPVENNMVLTAQDTTVTTGLVSNFMDMLVAQDPQTAAAMLYTVDFDDPDCEPYPLTDEQIAGLQEMLSTPVTDYEIAGCVFDTPDSNEIRCRVTVGGRFTTNWYFKPVRYIGNWYLCLKDSSTGDRSLDSESAEIAR